MTGDAGYDTVCDHATRGIAVWYAEGVLCVVLIAEDVAVVREAEEKAVLQEKMAMTTTTKGIG